MTRGSLIAVVAVSTMLFGAVESWAMAVVGVMTSLAFIFFIMKRKDSGHAFSPMKGIMASGLLLLAYPLFQLLPFPLSILGFVHRKLPEIVTLSEGAMPWYHSVSLYPFATEMELARLCVYLMVFFMAAFGMEERDYVFGAMKALIVFGFVVALFGIIQQASWNGRIYWFRELTHGGTPFGPFVNRNHFAGFIGMIIPISLGISFRSKSVDKRVIYAFAGVVMAIALIFSLSRGGMISFVAGLLVFSFFILIRGMSRKKLIIPLFLFVLVLAVYLLYLGIAPVTERFSQSGVSDEQRFAAWQATLSAVADYPVFGSGLGTFQHIFSIYKPEGLYLYWDHAHNDYLELLLEVGIAGVIIGAVFFFFVLKTVLLTEWRDRDLYTGAAVLSSIATMAVHSIFDFNLHIPSNAILFWLILGLGVSLSRKNGTEHSE